LRFFGWLKEKIVKSKLWVYSVTRWGHKLLCTGACGTCTSPIKKRRSHRVAQRDDKLRSGRRACCWREQHPRRTAAVGTLRDSVALATGYYAAVGENGILYVPLLQALPSQVIYVNCSSYPVGTRTPRSPSLPLHQPTRAGDSMHNGLSSSIWSRYDYWMTQSRSRLLERHMRKWRSEMCNLLHVFGNSIKFLLRMDRTPDGEFVQ
jgi:hypothetical protein